MYSADPKEIVKTFKKRNEFWYFAFSKVSDVLKIGVASIWPGSLFPCTFLFFLQSMKLTSFDAQIPESLDMKQQKSATNFTYWRVSAKEEKDGFQKAIWLATFISLLGIFGQFSDQKKTSTIAAGIRI